MMQKIKFSLAGLGLLDALFLTYKHLSLNEYCMIGNSCDSVISSVYGKVWGIPVALLGVIFYLCYLSILIVSTEKNLAAKVIEKIVLVSGTIVSVVFMIIQFFVLKSFCIFCTFSAIIIITLLIVVLNERRRKNVIK